MDLNERDIVNLIANTEEAILAKLSQELPDWFTVFHDILHSEMQVLLDNLSPEGAEVAT